MGIRGLLPRALLWIGDAQMNERAGRRGLIVSRGWVQAACLVTVFGFTVLGWLAIRAHTDAPPVPLQVVDPAGNVLFTGDDVHAGPSRSSCATG